MEDRCVYAVVNRTTGEAYVGHTECGAERRWGEHQLLLRAHRHHCNPFQEAFDQFGEREFELVVLELPAPGTELWRREKLWVAHYDQTRGCYNGPSRRRCAGQTRIGRPCNRVTVGQGQYCAAHRPKKQDA